MLSHLKNNKNLVLIFLLALLVRLIGITHGFPFIFHPDEPSVIRSALEIRFYPNPGHFDWPHFYFYTNYFLFMIFSKFRDIATDAGMRSMLSAIFPLVWNDHLIFYLISRIFSAFLGALTVIPVYLTARNLFNVRVGLLSALVFALIPFHVHHSHYALIDVPMVFWLSWAVYFSMRIYLNSGFKNYILAGLMTGFAASTKYNGGLVALCITFAHFFRVFNKRESLISLKNITYPLLSILFTFLGFFAGTPYSIFDIGTFLRADGPKGALWQFTNVGKVGFTDQVMQFFSSLAIKLSDDLGYVFILILIFGIAYIIKTRRDEETKRLSLMYIPAFIFLFYISGFEKNRSHYYMISYPFIAVSVGYLVYKLIEKFNNRFLVLVLIFIVPIILIAKNNILMMRKDTRVELYEWLVTNVTQDKSLVYNDTSVRIVLDAFPDNNIEKVQDSPHTVRKTGYFINASNSSVELNLEKVLEINSTFRNGPTIEVFKLQ